MSGAIPPLPQYVFMALCLIKPRDNFTFAFTSVLGLKVTEFQEGLEFRVIKILCSLHFPSQV
jgi:hypothetical protein